MMAPVITRTSSMRAAAVMGAPVIASWTAPTSCRPLSSTVIPAATIRLGLSASSPAKVPRRLSANAVSRIAGTVAMIPPIMFWKKNGRPRLFSSRLHRSIRKVVAKLTMATNGPPLSSNAMAAANVAQPTVAIHRL